MPIAVLRTVQPRLVATDGRRVPPGRRSNADSGREREYLTPAEVERLIKTARKRGRHGSRDALAIMMGYRHGLRVSELVALRWSQVDFTTARLTVHRAKGSAGSTHPILGDELRELRKIQRDQPVGNPFIFIGERGPVSVAWFQRMIKRVGLECGLPLVHGHMLRHSTGFALADRGRELREIQDFLGHRSINNTVIYTKLRPGRFDRIWD
jgi:type 1 fimbriae regulatory protein FimB/type 1 fimbriae regulatory protein FimE